MTETRKEHCATHGDYESRQTGFTDFWTRCWGCVQAEINERDQQARQKAQADQHAKEVVYMLGQSGMEGRMLRATFANFTTSHPAQTEVLAACQAFVDAAEPDAGMNLWLVGPPGTGKTHLGSAMVSHFILARHAEAAIFSARELVRMLRDTWGRRSGSGLETEGEVIDRFGRMGLLVVDEVGVGFDTDKERMQLLDVIDLRYKLGRPTVVLSNLKGPDMQKTLGERAYDRLRENSQLLLCKWPSHRTGGL